MKIEAGKYYLTRDGRKVGPMERYSGGQDGFSFCCGGNTYNSYGGYYSRGTSGKDLISEWTEEPTQGTLKELNVQPGDVVEFVEHPDGGREGEKGMLHFIRDGRRGIAAYEEKNPENGNAHYRLGSQAIFKIISRASQSTTPQGPVRTVTRKEIVPGVYGSVRVNDPGSEYVRININAAMPVADLTQAIETLTEIRDAMK